MRKSKVLDNITEAIRLCGLKDGMRISFHHHLRNGDYTLNMVMDEISRLGFHNIVLNASSIFDCHTPLIEHINNGVVARLETDYIGSSVGKFISNGVLKEPVVFRTHGGRAAAIDSKKIKIDIAFIAVSASDKMGNCTGRIGPSAFGSLGYAFPDAIHADKVVVITDYLVDYPLSPRSISEVFVDYVVLVDKIGNPSSIVSGTTQIPKNPTTLQIADLAANAIKASGLLKKGFSFQVGAGGASLATAAYIHKIMRKEGIIGSYVLGGVSGYSVRMARDGCFKALQDVQCFDLEAVESLNADNWHIELSASEYASPFAKSNAARNLDAVILGATEIDLDFNVNVHTDSLGNIIGGSGGHGDVSEEAALTVITAPIFRTRFSTIKERVTCISTRGENIDLLATQAGIAVNPNKPELKERLIGAGLPVTSIQKLKELADNINGIPKKLSFEDRVVANVLSRNGELIDRIYQLKN